MVGQDIQIVAVGLSPANATGKTGANGDFEFRLHGAGDRGQLRGDCHRGWRDDRPATTISVQAASTGCRCRHEPSHFDIGIGESERRRYECLGIERTTDRRSARLVLGASNTPIQNVRVRFDLNGDVNTIGGTFSTGDTNPVHGWQGGGHDQLHSRAVGRVRPTG